jgi:hypothetical protein
VHKLFRWFRLPHSYTPRGCNACFDKRGKRKRFLTKEKATTNDSGEKIGRDYTL